MDPNPYNDVNKNPQSTFYGALSGSVCFPMPLMYNPMNSYPFMSAPFLPMHHPMLSNHGLQDSHVLNPASDSMQLAKSSEDLSTRAFAYLQSRYQSMGKCFLPPSRKSSKYCPSIVDVQSTDEKMGYSDPIMGVTSNSTSYSDKDCYLSSPGTEVEEPDSSGKRSTDVIEQKVIPRWNCDSSQPPICPICGRTIPLQDLSDHYLMELDKLNDLVTRKEWLNGDEELMTSSRYQSYHDVERRCPEFRKETYLRVRANRINRLAGPRSKRLCMEDSWKLQKIGPLVSPKKEDLQEENTAHQSMLMLELTDQTKSGLADSSSCNNLEVASCPTDSKQSMEEDNPCSSLVDIKCQVCLESYKKPVVSVCCWHVHCETCWLKSLGSKRVCPQCDTITSPADLRRIHL
ncbi:uncharacterized protein [Parasteatoda tepidariorum]|uniref:uncharacterized protein isoform X2 n=1 Tax=Parasteatoda tepidariorum TaxID=114398 RepID=UPI0039BCECE4